MIYHILSIFILIPNLPYQISNINREKTRILQKDTLVYSITAKIKGELFRADYRSNYKLIVTNSKNDTLIDLLEEGISPVPLIFEDYNNDGNLDIRYGYNSNYYYEMILLFDPKARKFKKIDGINNPEFAYSKNIKGTKFYYSYSPHGCGKSNWISNLFVLSGRKINTLGKIYYRQCEDDKKGIYIYKLTNKKEVFLKKMPLDNTGKYDFGKYWTINYKKYTRQ